MKKLTALLLLPCLFAFSSALAQQASLKGTVVDTSSKQNLHHAVISLLKPKDSVLVKFGRTDSKGNFEIKNLPAGHFIMIVSYPDYADFTENLSIEAQKETDLGLVRMTTKAHLLEEVIVKQRVAAIRMKGDTTEYRADSFHVGPNANVQDLLKRMPGIQVNSKGEITAQGQKVEKILVDGEEFFSDDPAVVTQNLRADAVDKVQVFDKKSDQAAFTGIDDGQKTRTLNVQLKENKKKGYFGKVEAGSDFQKYRYGKAMVNAFRGKRKFAAYITNDNTRFESLNWNEKSNYSSDPNRNIEVGDDGSMMMYSRGDDFSYGRGFPNSTTGGFLFANKWNQDKHNLNGTYQYNKLNVKGSTLTTTQTILPDTTFINKSEQHSVNDRSRNRLNSIYEWQIDSSSSLKVTITGSVLTNRNANNFLGKAISEEGQLINQSDRVTTNSGEDRNLVGNVFWRKKLKKKGRTISFNSDFSSTDRSNDGFLFAKNQFYDKTGTLVRQDNIDQLKTNREVLFGINGRAVYTEPLWKNSFLELNYRFGINQNDAERNTMEKTGVGGKYENRVDSLSNHFVYNTFTHAGGFTFRLNEKKFNFFAGTAVGTSSFTMNDIRKNTDRSISFTNFLPNAGISFMPRKQKRMSLNYNGNTRNPSLQQIQPFIDNIDPLNITIGNANLKQEFRHNFNFNFSDYKVLKSRNIWLGGGYTFTNNAISNASFIDSIGRRVNQAINVNGNYNGYLWSQYGIEIAPSYNLNFGFSPNINRNINMINGIRNISDNRSYGFSVGLGHWSDKKLNFHFNVDARRNYSRSSIRPDVVTEYMSYSSWSDFNLKLPAKFFFQLQGEINVYEKTNVFANNRNTYIVNSSLKKTFGKSDKLEMKFSVNDIFNQNQGIRRNISSNFITETVQQGIQRFWLFTVAYNFSKNGKPSN